MKLKCPECGGELVWIGFRPLFPTCSGCGKVFHVDECVED